MYHTYELEPGQSEVSQFPKDYNVVLRSVRCNAKQLPREGRVLVHLGQGPKKNLCAEFHSFVICIKLILKYSKSKLTRLLRITGWYQ